MFPHLASRAEHPRSRKPASDPSNEWGENSPKKPSRLTGQGSPEKSSRMIKRHPATHSASGKPCEYTTRTIAYQSPLSTRARMTNVKVDRC
ncbi:MAG: hypothetical protein CMJ59_11770 [Planctomycetaceae bacterium]|nr:hypothetical protein [Planctomycetaceae bacterium]